jgi:hypothetical protein
MKRLFPATSFRWQRLLLVVSWGALIVLIVVSTPFLFDLIGRGIDWIIGLFPHPDEVWREYPWCF